jgi:hypothetical protein
MSGATNVKTMGCKVLVLAVLGFNSLALLAQSPGVAGGPPYGGCAAPQTAGVSLCQPPSFYQTGQVSSPFQVIASATSSTAAVQLMQLWVDGQKFAQSSGSLFNQAVTLSEGSHQFTAVEIDATGFYLKSTPFSVVVTGNNQHEFCPPPGEPGVNVCTPQMGACITQPFMSILAGGRGASGTVSRMELLKDGVVIANFAGNQINTGLVVMGGDKLTIIEVDTKGATKSTTIVVAPPC